jgi:hypothetical protein
VSCRYRTYSAIQPYVAAAVFDDTDIHSKHGDVRRAGLERWSFLPPRWSLVQPLKDRHLDLRVPVLPRSSRR